ncbi:hypothetical protein AAVH_12908 [Aphelenchoides avenae]|nr:hypothetical protein AAVH_12908 [Aphelenchus avenae]
MKHPDWTYAHTIPYVSYSGTPGTGRQQFCATSACVALVMASQAHSLLYRMIVLLQRPEIEEIFLSRKGIAFFGCTHVLGAVVLAFFARFALTTEPWPFHEPKYAGFQGPADDVYLCVKFDLFEAKRVVLVSVLLAQGGIWMVIVVGAMLVILAQVRRNKKTMVMSQKTCRMHLYFVRLLLAQIAVPFLCFIVPGTCAAVVIFLKTFTFVPRAPLLALIISEICILLLAIFPLVNGILTLRFVAPYWRFTKDLLLLVRPRPSPSVQGIVNTSSMQSITEAKTPAFPVDFIRGRQMYVRRGLLPKLNGRIGAPRFDEKGESGKNVCEGSAFST